MTQHFQQHSKLPLRRVLLGAAASAMIMIGGPAAIHAQESDPAPVPQSAEENASAPVSAPVPASGETAPAEQTADTAAQPEDTVENAVSDAEKQPNVSKPVMFDPAMVTNLARNLAKQPFVNPHRELPEALSALSAEDYAQIRFKSQRAFFNPAETDFSLELFHPGTMYDATVKFRSFLTRPDCLISARLACRATIFRRRTMPGSACAIRFLMSPAMMS